MNSVTMAKIIPFANIPINELTLPALIARFNATIEKSSILELISHIMTLDIEKQPSIKDCIKMTDHIVKYFPELVVCNLSDIVVKESSNVVKRDLVFVVDLSGSMSHIVNSMKDQLINWINNNIDRYNSLKLIFFGTNVYGPYDNVLNCINVSDGGSTRAKPALKKLNDVTRENAKENPNGSDVIMITDGQFDEKMDAYSISPMLDIERFVILFPHHTPSDATGIHYRYLPNITKPGISICVFKYGYQSNDLYDALDTYIKNNTDHHIIKSNIYTRIGNYGLLANISIGGMNSIVERLLNETDTLKVQTFLNDILGIYQFMINHTGDILNALRSNEIKALWQFLRPLQKQLHIVDEQNIHNTTIQVVSDEIDKCSNTLIGMRDAKVASLKNEIKQCYSVADKTRLENELNTIRDAFNELRRVDESERIDIEVEKLIAKGHKFLWVKNDQLDVPDAVICQYPNISKPEIEKIHQCICSIKTTTDKYPGSRTMVIDPYQNGLILMMKKLAFDRDRKFTLSTTLVTKILCGFFCSHLNGKIDPNVQKNIIIASIIDYVTKHLRNTVISNITITDEPVNMSYRSLKILYELSTLESSVKITQKPKDLTLWTKIDDNNNENNTYCLNSSLLFKILRLYEGCLIAKNLIYMSNDKKSIKCVAKNYINITDFRYFITVTKGKSCQEWIDEVVQIKKFNDGSTMEITNGMITQEKICSNAKDFIHKYWYTGHRLINKSGAIHPAAEYGNSNEKAAVKAWFIKSWKECFDELHRIGKIKTNTMDILPSVTDTDDIDIVCDWFEQRIKFDPIFWIKEHTEQIPLDYWIISIKDIHQSSQRMALYVVSKPQFEIPALNELIKYIDSNEFNNLVGIAKSKNWSIETKSQIDAHIASANFELSLGKFYNLRDSFSLLPIQTSNKNHKTSSFWESLCNGSHDETISSILDKMIQDQIMFDEADFCCPITCALLEDPVEYGGHIFER